METLTVASFFEAVTGVVSGLVTGAATFVADLWSANVIGQIMICLGLAGTVIGIAKALFLRTRKVRG